MREVIRRDEGTVASSIEAHDGREKRVAPRFTLLIRAAKLISQDGEFMCIIRDASESGVNVRLFHPLPDCGTMLLELPNGDRHELELVWQDGDRAGLKFIEQADIARIVESPSRFAKRPIRINLEADAVIQVGEQQNSVELLDLSQQGAKLTSDAHFAIDQRVKISANGMPQVNAKIRWRRGNSYGLVFEDTFQFGDLARIVASMQLELRD